MSRADSHPVADTASAVSHIEREADEIRTEQVERALQQLEAQGDLTEEQRAAVEALSERLVEQLVAVPRRTLRNDESRGDTAETAIALFSRGSGR